MYFTCEYTICSMDMIINDELQKWFEEVLKIPDSKAEADSYLWRDKFCQRMRDEPPISIERLNAELRIKRENTQLI